MVTGIGKRNENDNPTDGPNAYQYIKALKMATLMTLKGRKCTI